MDKIGKIYGDVWSKVRNRHSHKVYIVFTHPERGYDHWVTDIIPMRQKKRRFGLGKATIPDLEHPLVSLVKNNKKDALNIHFQIKSIVGDQKEEDWFHHFHT